MRLSQAIFATLSCTALAAALACGKISGGATEVKDTFSHTCATDTDCALVFFGGTCGICNSANGAIATSARSAYQKAYNAAYAHCPADRVVGDCPASYGVSQCSATKTCTYVSCGGYPPKDEHHCPADGG